MTEPQRILALETSSLRGSVALLECEAPVGGQAAVRLVAYRAHEVLNEHAERMLKLVEEALAEAQWNKRSLTKLAVGVGPGSFTGVRVALSLAQGLLVGLGIEGVGIGSLRALAAGLPAEDQRTRVVVRDARRDEFFVAVYDAAGRELEAPHTIAQADGAQCLQERFFSEQGLAQWGECVIVGYQLSDLPYAENDETREPDARAVGRLAARLDAAQAPVEPEYVRGPNLVKPKLLPSPLLAPRS